MGYAQLVIGREWKDSAAENFDYPLATGQIELFSHVQPHKNFVKHLQRKNFTICAVYMLDSQVDQHLYPISLVPLSPVGSRESEASKTQPNQENRKKYLKLNK